MRVPDDCGRVARMLAAFLVGPQHDLKLLPYELSGSWIVLTVRVLHMP